jgi:hypothetical protein
MAGTSSGRLIFDYTVLVIATVLAAVGVGGLIVDELSAARARGGRRLGADLVWTLVWAVGLTVLLVAAWASFR